MLRQLLFSLCIAAGICSYGFELIKGTIDRSEIYPGTVRTFTVSVPEGYDGSSPACLYVSLDGALYNAQIGRASCRERPYGEIQPQQRVRCRRRQARKVY